MHRTITSLLLAACALVACERRPIADPETGARDLLARFRGDPRGAQSLWLAGDANWSLGLADVVAWQDPVAPIAVCRGRRNLCEAPAGDPWSTRRASP